MLARRNEDPSPRQTTLSLNRYGIFNRAMSILTHATRRGQEGTFTLRTVAATTYRLAVAIAFLLVAASLVPSEEMYQRLEHRLSYVVPIGQLTEHIRSGPATASSLLLEIMRKRDSLEVAGVQINLSYAVNPSDRVQEHSFMSQTLGQERTYWVYLPPGYEESDEPFPTLYLLHGMSQNHRWWAELARVDRIATAMIAQGRIRPAIIVMPNGNRVQYDMPTTSIYDNACETGLDTMAQALKAIGKRLPSLNIYKVSCEGNFEQYVVVDLFSEIDSSFRTSDERYIGGFSIGGRGAVQLAVAHGDVLDGAFGLSGNYNFVRHGIRSGERRPAAGTKLFLASGSMDQRGIYGDLSTMLLHSELERQGIDHAYCTYRGTHDASGWVSVMPDAMGYLLAPETKPPAETTACIDLRGAVP